MSIRLEPEGPFPASLRRFEQRFGGPGEVAGHVLVEAGTESGREPTAIIELRSYLAAFLTEKGWWC